MQITNEPAPGWRVTVMRPGTALCSPCSFYTSSPPSPFFLPLSPPLPLSPVPSPCPSSSLYLSSSLSLNAPSLPLPSTFLCPICPPLPPSIAHSPLFLIMSSFTAPLFPPLLLISSLPFLIPLLFLSCYLLFSCRPLSPAKKCTTAPSPFPRHLTSSSPLLSQPLLSFPLRCLHYELAQVD